MISKYVIRCYEKQNGGPTLIYDLMDEPVSKEQAEEMYNDHTFYYTIHTEPKDKLYIRMKEMFIFEEEDKI